MGRRPILGVVQAVYLKDILETNFISLLLTI